MKKFIPELVIILLLSITGFNAIAQTSSWVRINLLGYKPNSTKVAVWCSKEKNIITNFTIVEVTSGKTVYAAKASNAFGGYGPFTQTCRLNFSAFARPGRYIIKAGSATSPEFTIIQDVYKGTANFCLRYMRQQRSGFNPFLKDSCHTHDGYTLYGPMPDSTRIDASGGWHDASDYLQYATTSANATWHLLAAYRDFPKVFADEHLANGLPGKNNQADVLDEARWGLNWLLKMHPKKDWLFNQIADDRDHHGMRIPKEDSFYGRGYERPVYFCTGTPQGFGRYKNRSTGVASTAGKFASAFALGATLFHDPVMKSRALSAWSLGIEKPGVCQTAPGRSPYFYEEDNWTDDMELAGACLYSMAPANKKFLTAAYKYAKGETITPWLGTDTARHYQWYPFINLGHYELAKQLQGKERKELLGYYKQGIDRVWQKAKQNAFYRGVPFIWCSNNLTTSFAMQCYWYRTLTGDAAYSELEQACFDWLFGCNPWGTSMVYGLPAWGDTPVDPHSAFTHLKQYPIDGGLVDGPVYGSIYKNLIGITLNEPDEYATFQSDLVVYHDDYGDYSTNEPTMDGTASLIYLLAAKEAGTLVKTSGTTLKQASQQTALSTKVTPTPFTYDHGAIARGDLKQKKLALVFTGDEYGDGLGSISRTLQQHNVKASFFLTGRFYRNDMYRAMIWHMKMKGHYFGPHSDRHLLYSDWGKRDSLLVTREQFVQDLESNYTAMQAYGINRQDARFFLPPFEWYNDSIASWTKQQGLQLVNFTPGTYSNADYTTPDMKNYRSSNDILDSIITYEQRNSAGLNGFILLIHVGTHPNRTDKFYLQLPGLINYLRQRKYELTTIKELLN
ncbi:cellulase [Niastella caeni]|uniref:Cellulase n=1 Tax=Niastella caeni TaxID=2569763 RepID=A0A4S8I158_9BACT|nr:glycoside hydrolase family 9 protein [Niastella caeni]THU41710.1 cellulase [Niastella caeni]